MLILDIFDRFFGRNGQQVIDPEAVSVKKYPLSAHLNDPDSRDVSYPFVAGSIAPSFPAQYNTDVSHMTRLWQGYLGTCVAHCYEFIKRLLDFNETGAETIYSRRFLYVLTRRFTNAVNTDSEQNQGLSPRDAAKILATAGIAKDSGQDDNSLPHSAYVNSYVVTDAMRSEAALYRSGGFAFPIIDSSVLKKAIMQNKAVGVTIGIDWSKVSPDGTVRPPAVLAGFHEVALYGWETVSGKERFIARNWWPELPNLYINSEDIEKVVYDSIVFTDIPNDLLLRAKQRQYVFLTDLKQGIVSDAVVQLQKCLKEYGLFSAAFSRSFGPATLQAVKDFQKLKGLTADGALGPKSRAALNESAGNTLSKSRLDLWCEAAKNMDGAKSYLNNPGNIRCNAIMNKNAISVSNNGFCMFPTYEAGYKALRDMFIRAATIGTANYQPTMTLYQFYAKYAPSNDGNDPNHYAEYVATHIGVSPSTMIKDLV
ncbi:MAG: peptidoglycan-binding protein [Patescibacteria group bacterium]